jgi:murein DD-endopeptidase MepM/ murein hydrolase activator NlpD
MGGIASGSGSRLVLRIALAGGLAGLLAGCADSQRLSDPFSNPFQPSARAVDPTPTASYNYNNAPAGAVQSRPLPAPSDLRSTNVPSPAYSAPVHPSPSLASAQPPATDMTSSVARGQSVAGWTAEGGTPVVVANGETIELIAKRYGIPPEALLRTNGFSASGQVRPGTRLIIPIYNASLAASSGARLAEAHPNTNKAAKPNEKLVLQQGPKAKAEAAKVAKNEPKVDPKKAALDKKDAKAAQALKEKELKAKEASKGQPLKSQVSAKIETPKQEPDAKAKGPNARKEAAKPGEAKELVAKTDVPATEPKKQAADPTPTASLPVDSPEFRWPAHGRIIQAFKNGGNDGINIALPEGTSVRAAEAGVVAYAGSELKGYGNLVLIRHPNGFVTAYANNGELDVKRGDTVKRGQVIAKSGQTGNVQSPQLHFELRKGSTPIDPTQYLASGV